MQSCQSGIATTSNTPLVAPTLNSSIATPSLVAQALDTETLAPTAAPSPTITASPSPTLSPDRPAVWILASSHFVALDTATGRMLNQTEPVVNLYKSAADKRWAYFLQVDRKEDDRWHVALTAFERARGNLAPSIALDSFPSATTSWYKDFGAPSLVLSRDGGRLFALLEEKIGAAWVTRLSSVDLQQRAASPPFTLFETTTAMWAPNATIALASDGAEIWVAQDFRREDPSNPKAAFWTTRFAVVNVNQNQVERVVEVPGEISAEGLFSELAISPDGRKLYAVEYIDYSGGQIGYRFVALDLSTRTVAFAQELKSNPDSERFCGADGLRFTPEGHYLWGWCGNSISFLDPQSGRVSQRIVLASQPALNDFNPRYVLASPDAKLIYVVSFATREIFAIDLAKREVVRHAKMTEPETSFSNPFDALGQWLAPTASAKLFAQPGAVLSADGQRLYFVEIDDIDAGDGIWAVDAATFKPIGHWLKKTEVVGIQLSADGRELFALGMKDRKLYALDAQSGELRRAFDLPLSNLGGFVPSE